MDMRIIHEIFADWIIRYVRTLTIEILAVYHAMSVIFVLPDFAGILLSNSEGVTTLDKLSGLLDRFSWSKKHVDVIGHYDESVEKIAFLFAITGEGGD
jgi:hypothetical protein